MRAPLPCGVTTCLVAHCFFCTVAVTRSGTARCGCDDCWERASVCGCGEEDCTYSLSGSVAHFMLAERWPVRRPSWTVARNCYDDCWKLRVCVRIRRSLRFRSPWFWSSYVHCQEHHHCCRQTLPSRRSVVPAKFSASAILLVFSPLCHGVIVLASGISSRRRARLCWLRGLGRQEGRQHQASSGSPRLSRWSRRESVGFKPTSEFRLRYCHPSFERLCSFRYQVLAQLDLLTTYKYIVTLPKELDEKVASLEFYCTQCGDHCLL